MSPHRGFLGFPAELPGGAQPSLVLFGAPHGTIYPGADASGLVGAAASPGSTSSKHHAPSDIDGLTAIAGARVLANVIGRVVRQG